MREFLSGLPDLVLLRLRLRSFTLDLRPTGLREPLLAAGSLVVTLLFLPVGLSEMDLRLAGPVFIGVFLPIMGDMLPPRTEECMLSLELDLELAISFAMSMRDVGLESG